MIGGRNHWTAEEDEWLREAYPHATNSTLEAEHERLFPGCPRRSASSIKVRANKFGVAKADAWTHEEEEWLRETYPHASGSSVAKAYSERFPERPAKSREAIKQRAYKLGIEKSKDYNPCPRTVWTPDKIEWFVGFTPGHSEREISAEHERLYGEPLTRRQISNAKTNFNVRSGVFTTRFKPGEVGNPEWVKPVGSECVRRHGIVYVKVAEKPSEPNLCDNWKPKHHIAYEKAHGPIPDGCNVVFADGDKRNFDPENLVAVPRNLGAIIARHKLRYFDAESLEVVMNVARLIAMRAGIMREETNKDRRR